MTMYAKIKQLADEALALQNKTRMDAVLREISGMCENPPEAVEVSGVPAPAVDNDKTGVADGANSPAAKAVPAKKAGKK
jgi:hypothetical protein